MPIARGTRKSIHANELDRCQTFPMGRARDVDAGTHAYIERGAAGAGSCQRSVPIREDEPLIPDTSVSRRIASPAKIPVDRILIPRAGLLT